MLSVLFRRIIIKLNLTRKENGYRLLYLGYTLRMPILTAMAMRLLLQQMDVPQNRESDKRIIIILKSAGIDDVRESLMHKPVDAKVDRISRSVFKTLANYYLEDRVADLYYDTGDPDVEKAKQKYKKHLKKAFRHFSKFYGCDVIVQFNYYYFAEREVAAACSELGIRFLTAHKECLNSEPMEAYKVERLGEGFGKYRGYKISVYNQSQKNVIVKSEFAREERVEITGCPRLNASHRKRKITPPADQKTTILYYLIHNVAGLPVYKIYDNGRTKRGVYENGRVSTWQPMIDEVNLSLLKIAESNPDIRIILKTKTGATGRQLGNFNLETLPENIEIVRGGVGHDLLDESHIVVGFNSTAVLEAMAAGRITIVPFFKNLLNPEILPYAINLENGVITAESKQMFEKVLQEAIKDAQIMEELGPNQARMLDKYLGNGDGLAHERYRSFIEDALHTEPSAVKDFLSQQ